MIFIIFLAFLYSTLEPAIKIDNEKEFLLEYLEAKLIDRLNTNLTTLTVTLTSSSACVVLDELIDNSIQLNSRIVVKNESRGITSSYVSNGDSGDLLIDRDSVENNFFKIYGSDEFDSLGQESVTGCEVLNDYEINLLKSDEYISMKNVRALEGSYQTNYESLKEEFEIPEGSDFGFGFVYSNGTVIETSNENVSRNIYVEEFPVQYLDRDANVLSGKIKVSVW